MNHEVVVAGGPTGVGVELHSETVVGTGKHAKNPGPVVEVQGPTGVTDKDAFRLEPAALGWGSSEWRDPDLPKMPPSW